MPVRHGNPYQSNLIRSIIETIKPLPDSAPIVTRLLKGDSGAIKAAYELARRHGLVVAN